MLKTSTVQITDIENYRVTKTSLACPNIKTGCLTALLLILTATSPAYAFKIDTIKKHTLVHKVNDGSGFRVDDISGVSGQNISIRMNLPGSVTRNLNSKTWLRVIGLPEKLSLSKGSKVNNIWFMSAEDMRGLQLKSPADFRGKFNVKFFLMRGDKSVVTIIGQTAINVSLKPASKETVRSKSANLTSRSAPTVTNAVPAIPPEVEQQTAQRAQKFLKMGDIATARMLYENLAVQGSARASFALGQTYDPEFLKKLLVRGLKPDVAKARTWYKKALKLGQKYGVNFASGKPEFNVFLDRYSQYLGITNGRLTETQKEIFQAQYSLM